MGLNEAENDLGVLVYVGGTLRVGVKDVGSIPTMLHPLLKTCEDLGEDSRVHPKTVSPTVGEVQVLRGTICG